MSSRYEVEVTVTSAKDLKNVNWRHGANKPYAVVWVDSDRKFSTRVDDEGDTSPRWDQTLKIPLDRPLEDATLYIDVVHAYAEPDTKPLIGSAKLKLREVADEVGIGSRLVRSLKLKRPSGRPHGKLEVEVTVRDPARYPAPSAYGVPPYGVAVEKGYGGTSYVAVAPPAGYPYGQPASSYSQHGYAQPGYPQSGYAQPGYSQPGYAQPGYGYGQGTVVVEEKKKSKFGGMGMGTGLAVGAVGGLLGGLAIAEGVDAIEDHIADEAAEKVEDDIGGDDFYDGGDDDGGW